MENSQVRPVSQITRNTPMQRGGRVTAKLMLFATYEIDGCLKHLYHIAEGLQESDNGEDRAIDAIAKRIDTMNLKFMSYFDEVGDEFPLHALAHTIFPRHDRATEELDDLLNEADQAQLAEAAGNLTASELAGRAERVALGAREMIELLRSIGNISDATRVRLGEDNDDPDTRDYVAMTKLVTERLEMIFASAQDADIRQGFLRALTDLICRNADGGGVGPRGWNPISATEYAFSGQLDEALIEKAQKDAQAARRQKAVSRKAVTA